MNKFVRFAVLAAVFVACAVYQPLLAQAEVMNTIITYAGGGRNLYPSSVAVDGSGNVYFSDPTNQLVRKIDHATGVVTTVAGTGTPGYSGDGGIATSAALSVPQGITLDGSGNLYIADSYNHVIRKVTPSGVISTVAGSSSPGYAGDGGPATAAQLYYPLAVAVNGAGELYIADTSHAVRKVSSSGIITTVAGGGPWGELGDGAAATSAWVPSPSAIALDRTGKLYISSNSRVRMVDGSGIITTVAGNGEAGYGGDNGPATSARLSPGVGLAVDGEGNLYISDNSNVIRKVDSAGVITTVAGGGHSGSDGIAAISAVLTPGGIAVDASGNLYIAETSEQRVRKVTALTGIITTVATAGSGHRGDGGFATSAALSSPQGIAMDDAGNLFIADTFNNRIRKVTAATGVVSTVAGTDGAGYSADLGPATQASLHYPHAVALDRSGNLYVADTYSCRVRKIDTRGMITTVAGSSGGCSYSGDGGPATEATLSYPQAIIVDGSGNLYISDGYGNAIRKVDSSGIITTVAGNGSSGYSGDGEQATAAQLSMPIGMALDGSGNLYIADQGNNRIRKVDSNGVITTVVGNGKYGYSGDGGPASAAELSGPSHLFVDGSGNMYISDSGNHVIRKVDSFGIISTIAGGMISAGYNRPGYSGDGGPATLAALFWPRGITMDGSGNLYIADSANHRIREIVANVLPVTSASPGGGSYSAPQRVTLAAKRPVTTYYTTDGSTPTTSSQLYTGPITISSTTTLRFFSQDGAGNSTAVQSANYIISITAPGTTASPAGGLFNVPQTVVLSCSDSSGPGCDGTYYCLGSGCTPTARYNAPIQIPDSQVLRFYSKDSAGQMEAVQEARYTIFSGYIPGGSSLPNGLGAINSYAGGMPPLGISESVAVDGAGNIYLADTANNVVRRVSAATGVITIVAGTGAAGYSGDGGPATGAMLHTPQGVSLDGSGNLYIVDTNNRRIRKVAVGTGVITSVAGNGNYFYPGDGSPAITAGIYPSAVAVDDAGNIFLADNNVIRKVDGSGIITTVAGGGVSGELGDGGAATSASLQAPLKLALDGSGNLYIADFHQLRIRKVDSSGVITTVAGDGSFGYGGDNGPATSAQMTHPRAVALDGSGNLYIADSYNQVIRKVDRSGIITTVAGGGTGGGDGGAATSTEISHPMALAADGSGDLYIAENYNGRIRKVTAATGIITTVVIGGSDGTLGDGASAAASSLVVPHGVVVDNAGNLYIADSAANRIRKVHAATGVITTIAGNGSHGYSGDLGPATQASLSWPQGLALDGSGNLYVADNGNGRIRKIDTSGVITTVAGGGAWCYDCEGVQATEVSLYYPRGLAVDGSGNIFISENENIRKVDASGKITTVAGTQWSSGYSGDGGPAKEALLTTPVGMVADASGSLYIADSGNNCIRKIDRAGVITTVAGTGLPGSFGDGGPATAAYLMNPAALALDGDGNLYISDSGNNLVRRVDAATGSIETVAGDFTGRYIGDGGPARMAALYNPLGLALDGKGNLYIADLGNSRVRIVGLKLPQSITFDALDGKTYGDAPFTPTASGGGSGNAITLVSSNPAVAITNGATVTIVGAGTTTITASQAGNANYLAAADVAQTLTVEKAALTVSANNAGKIYGAANPTLTISYSGLVNGDTAANMSSQPTVSTTATTGSAAGTYPITVSGGSSPNYDFSYQPGTLTVDKAPLTVTANNATRSYGAANPAFTVSYSGFVNGDTAASLSSQPTATTAATAATAAGNYPITASGGTSANYSFSYRPGTLTVEKAILTVTANNVNRSQGTSNPELSVSYSGFVNDETQSVLTGAAALSTAATVTSPAGSYPVVVAQGTLAAENYSFALVNGILTVDDAAEFTVSVTVAGDGSGTVTSVPPGISCTGGTCNGTFSSGETIRLIATMSNGSSFDNWSGACSGAGECQFQLSGPQSVSATFGVQRNVQIVGWPGYFAQVQLAYEAALSGVIMRTLGVALSGNLLLDSDKTVTIQGGYDKEFNAQNSFTTMHGSMKIRRGKVVINRFKVR